MTDLYRHHGGEPGPLPFQAQTPAGEWRTDLANHPESRAECGYTLGPAKPLYNAATHDLVWNVLTERWQIVALPPAPPVAPSPVVLYPADLWRRTTNAEAEAIDAAMEAQPLRIRRLFDAAQTYQSDDPLWPLLTGAAVNLFGAARAAELLAPS